MEKLPRSQRNIARRVDAWVRASHPHVDTELHEIDKHHHIIFADKDVLSEEDFKTHFDSNVTPLTHNINFSNTRPRESTILPRIEDCALANNLEGFLFTLNDFRIALDGLFPGLPELTGSDFRDDGTLEIWFAEDIPIEVSEQVMHYLYRNISFRNIVIVTRKKREPKLNSANNEPDIIRYRPLRERTAIPEFVRNEEQWWFDNLDQITEGTITTSSLISNNETGMACHISGTMPAIDIRQALLAYDTIYLQLPLIDTSRDNEDWDKLGVSKEDLLYLIAEDRVRIIHSQPEERSDLGFLREAYECNPSGVLGRRKTAALVYADMVETDNEYIFSQDKFFPQVQELIKVFGEREGFDKHEFAKSLMFPKFARRSWITSFSQIGAMGIEPYGQGELFANAVEKLQNKEVKIEAFVFGQEIQISHALNATYIPHGPIDSYVGTWIEPMKLMGDRLNFYRSLNGRIGAAWATNERFRIETTEPILPPVPLFNFNEHAPVKDIVEFTSRSSVRRKGRALVNRLANLPPEERISEITNLEKEIYAFQSTREISSEKRTWIESGVDIGTAVAGLAMPPFFSGITMLQKSFEFGRRNSKIDALLDEIEKDINDKFGKNEDIHFLSKISRVANIKKI